MDQRIERAAKAISDVHLGALAWPQMTEGGKAHYRAMAEAALAYADEDEDPWVFERRVEGAELAALLEEAGAETEASAP